MSSVDDRILKATMVMAQSIYGSLQDPTQIAINEASNQKLQTLNSRWFFYTLDESQRPVSWVVVIPTQLELMHKFLTKQITEQELLDQTKPSPRYDALYLCSAITIPQYRRQGLAYKLISEAVTHYQQRGCRDFFAWPWSAEGSALIYRLQQDKRLTIHLRSS